MWLLIELPESVKPLVTGFSSGPCCLLRCDVQSEVLKYIAATWPSLYARCRIYFEEWATARLRANYLNILTVDPVEQNVIEWKNSKISTATMIHR